MATEEFVLSAKYKQHDSLAAETVRSCRYEIFLGRLYLKRVESIAEGSDTVSIKTLLPKEKSATPALDVVSMYGFRPKVPCLWYLSPWEFTQWFFLHKLKAPTYEYKLTLLTEEGRNKKVMAKNCSDQAKISSSCLFMLPPSSQIFDGAPRVSYEALRCSWIFVKREKPVVPAPVDTPLPTSYMYKHHRSKLYTACWAPTLKV